MKKTLLIILFSFLCASTPTSAQGIVFLDSPVWENVLETARRQNKLIFMDCYTEWCGPCRMLADRVFPQAEVGEFFNANFINVKYDMEKGEGKVLYEKYKPNIVGFPTLLLIDGQGDVVHQIAGFLQSDELIAGMKAGMEGKSVFSLRKRYGEGERGPDFMSDYVASLKMAFLEDEAEAVMNDFIRSIPPDSLLSPHNWALVGDYVKDPYSPQFEHALQNLTMLVRRPDIDSYKLERQFAGALEYAVGSLTHLHRDKDDNLLPLDDDPQKIEKLRSLIDINNLRKAETMRAVLLVHELKLAGKWEDALDCVELYSRIGALGYADRFAVETIHYIALNTSDKTILNRCLAIMQRIQESDGDANRQIVFAAIYASLGDKDKADHARSLYDEHRRRIESEWEEMINEHNKR